MAASDDAPKLMGPKVIDPGTEILTARLRIMPVQLRWLTVMFREFTPAITHYMSVAPSGDIADTAKFVRDAQRRLAEGTDLIVAILDRANGEYMGNCGVHGLQQTMPSIGVWIKVSAHGKGYGREAIGGLIAWVRSQYDFDAIGYVADRANTASRRIALHYGGVESGQHYKTVDGGRVLDMIEYSIPLKRSLESSS